jgi:hypothetical protein
MRAVLALLLFIVALGLLPASARVGETLEQCKKRYGKAVGAPTPYEFADEAKELVYCSFQKSGIDILIGFLNGKAADLSFHHHHDPAAPAPDPTDPTAPSDAFTQVEIDTLLADNANDLTWKTVPDGVLTFFPDSSAKTNTRYGAYQQRDDGVYATVDGTTLHIFTPEWMTYINAKMLAHNERIKMDQKKALEGF